MTDQTAPPSGRSNPKTPTPAPGGAALLPLLLLFARVVAGLCSCGVCLGWGLLMLGVLGGRGALPEFFRLDAGEEGGGGPSCSPPRGGGDWFYAPEPCFYALDEDDEEEETGEGEEDTDDWFYQ